jgi:hypothetical protein
MSRHAELSDDEDVKLGAKVFCHFIAYRDTSSGESQHNHLGVVCIVREFFG